MLPHNSPGMECFNERNTLRQRHISLLVDDNLFQRFFLSRFFSLSLSLSRSFTNYDSTFLPRLTLKETRKGKKILVFEDETDFVENSLFLS